MLKRRRKKRLAQLDKLTSLKKKVQCGIICLMWHKPQAETVRTRYKCHHICQLSVHFPQNKFVPRQRANRWMMWASAHFNGLSPAMFVCAVYLFVLIFILGTFSDSINFKMANNLWFAVNDLWFRFTRAARFSRKLQVGVGWFRWTLFESFSPRRFSSFDEIFENFQVHSQ